LRLELHFEENLDNG
jgi:TolA-binding protein